MDYKVKKIKPNHCRFLNKKYSMYVLFSTLSKYNWVNGDLKSYSNSH